MRNHRKVFNLDLSGIVIVFLDDIVHVAHLFSADFILPFLYGLNCFVRGPSTEALIGETKQIRD